VLVSGEGVWNDEVTVSTSQAFPVPVALSDDQLAVLDVVASAWGVLSNAGLAAGDLVLSDKSSPLFDAALSAVGKHLGYKIVDKVDENTKVKLAVSFATGSNFHNLASRVAFGGSIVSIAGLPVPASSAEGIVASVRSLVFNDLRIQGFDFGAWAATRPDEAARAVSEAAKLLAAGKVSIPVEKVAPEKFVAALTAASEYKAAAIVFGK
jgi:NADPH:quinone reductase-like Zn-dependent oxidoreductase